MALEKNGNNKSDGKGKNRDIKVEEKRTLLNSERLRRCDMVNYILGYELCGIVLENTIEGKRER